MEGTKRVCFAELVRINLSNKHQHFFYSVSYKKKVRKATTEPPSCSHGGSGTRIGAHLVMSDKAAPKVLLSLSHRDIIFMDTHLKKI